MKVMRIRIRRKLLISLLGSFLLTACDELKLSKEVSQAKNTEDSSFFYLLEDNNLSLTQEKAVYIPVYSEVFVMCNLPL